MKTVYTLISATALLAFTACGGGKTEEHNTPKTDSIAPVASTPETADQPMDSAAMQKAWENYMTPGSMHKWMASQDGNWKGEIMTWMGPDMPPSPASELKAEFEMILGGRYQESEYKGKMMGMDFEGHGLMAYDNARNKFLSTWVDNMGTGLMYMEGTYDEASKTVNMTGKMVDPSTGKQTNMRQVLKAPDDKTQIMEMYCEQKGKEFKSMEIRMTKK